MAAPRTESWRGNRGTWDAVFTPDPTTKSDNAAKGKGKGKGKTAGDAGNARDRSADGKRGGKPRGKAKAKGQAANGQASPKAAAIQAAAPPVAPADDAAPAPAVAPDAAPDAADKKRKTKHASGRYTLAGGAPYNFVGVFCPICDESLGYSTLFHRTCVVCDNQFPEALCSSRMRNFPFRARGINPDTPFGIVSAGNTSASTIKAAAAVVATDPKLGKKLPAFSNPKAKSVAAAKIASSAERKR